MQIVVVHSLRIFKLWTNFLNILIILLTSNKNPQLFLNINNNTKLASYKNWSCVLFFPAVPRLYSIKYLKIKNYNCQNKLK